MSSAWRQGRIGEIGVPASGERFVELLSSGGVVVEEIVSSADTPATTYEQDHDEWVAVLDGRALLAVDDEAVSLGPGDWLFIPAGLRHVVESVADGTRWLAVHLPPRA